MWDWAHQLHLALNRPCDCWAQWCTCIINSCWLCAWCVCVCVRVCVCVCVCVCCVCVVHVSLCVCMVCVHVRVCLWWTRQKLKEQNKCTPKHEDKKNTVHTYPCHSWLANCVVALCTLSSSTAYHTHTQNYTADYNTNNQYCSRYTGHHSRICAQREDGGQEWRHFNRSVWRHVKHTLPEVKR